jgi:hypothetical protein
MSQINTIALQRPARIAGLLLVAGFLLPLLALFIMVGSGGFQAYSAGLQGSIVEKAAVANTFRLTNLLYAVSWIVSLLGFRLLTNLLLKTSDAHKAVVAFNAILIASILGFLHGTFHMSVETWAAEEAARTGGIPPFYDALEVWVDAFFRVGYIAHLAGTAVFGWTIFRTRLLPSWIGRFVAGWSLIWLVGYFIGAGAPGILFFMPALIGIGLLKYE